MEPTEYQERQLPKYVEPGKYSTIINRQPEHSDSYTTYKEPFNMGIFYSFHREHQLLKTS